MYDCNACRNILWPSETIAEITLNSSQPTPQDFNSQTAAIHYPRDPVTYYGQILAPDKTMPQMNSDRICYSVKDAVQLTGIGRSTIYEAIRSKELRIYKLGAQILIFREVLIAWITKG
jgi:excisionase family DNA binding protein